MIMEEDGEVYTEKMVQYHREISKHERQLKRDIIFNRRRGILGEVSDSKKQIITSKTVLTILQKIKRKSKLTDEDINTLTCAFIQNESNIITFLNADSNLGLQALVRELTGVSSLIQLAVAECFVNMSLGNHKCCFKIAKSAGTYLITHLQGMNLNLKVPCIWALGNLVGSDIKTWKLLNSQGLLLLFLELLPITELQENVIYALTHYIKIGFNELLPSDFVSVAKSVMELNIFSPGVMWILYLLSCSSYCDNVISEMINFCLDVLINMNGYSVITTTAAIRIIGNLVSEESGRYAEIIVNNFEKIYMIFENLIKSENCYPHLINEIIWVIGNLVNHPSFIINEKIQSINNNVKQIELMYSSAIR